MILLTRQTALDDQGTAKCSTFFRPKSLYFRIDLVR